MKKLILLFLLASKTVNLLAVEAVIGSIKNTTKFQIEFSDTQVGQDNPDDNENYDLGNPSLNLITIDPNETKKDLNLKIDLDLFSLKNSIDKDDCFGQFIFRVKDEEIFNTFVIKQIRDYPGMSKFLYLKNKKYFTKLIHVNSQTIIIDNIGEPIKIASFDHSTDKDFIFFIHLTKTSKNSLKDRVIIKCQNNKESSDKYYFNIEIKSYENNIIYAEVTEIIQNNVNTMMTFGKEPQKALIMES